MQYDIWNGRNWELNFWFSFQVTKQMQQIKIEGGKITYIVIIKTTNQVNTLFWTWSVKLYHAEYL
jgi:hypothetical protein